MNNNQNNLSQDNKDKNQATDSKQNQTQDNKQPKEADKQANVKSAVTQPITAKDNDSNMQSKDSKDSKGSCAA